jgi:C4-dicarboxylate-binding protein DctP
MKKISLTKISILLLGMVAESLMADPITLRFSHVVEENTPKGMMALRLQELVNKRLDGKVNVVIYPNSSLYRDNEVLDAMLSGKVELAAPSLSKFQHFTKKLHVFDLPFLFRDMDAVERFQQSEAGRELLQSLETKMIVGLGYLHNGLKQLTSNQEVRVPADVSGKIFRIQNSDVLRAQFTALGAIPLKKPFSDVSSLLRSRSIDGTENTWSNIYSQKYHKDQKYILESNHGLLDYLVVTPAEFWYGLPDDIRVQLKTAIEDAVKFGNRVAREKAKTDRDAIIASKHCEVITLSESERVQWLKAMYPVWKQFEKNIGLELINAAVQANH